MKKSVNIKNEYSFLQLIVSDTNKQSENYLIQSGKYLGLDIPVIFKTLADGGLPISICNGALVDKSIDQSTISLLKELATYKLIKINSDIKKPQVSLHSTGEYFDLTSSIPQSEFWKISRFSYMHVENDQMIIRNPLSTCYLVVYDVKILNLFHLFQHPVTNAEIYAEIPELQKSVFDLFVKAEIVAPCNDKKICLEDIDDTKRQWAFHDLVFHSLSRLGRTEKDIGGSYRFNNIIAPQPAIKENIWKENSISLPKPDMHSLIQHDYPFTQVLESRTSIRKYSILPLSIDQLGEFLFRAVRTRYEYSNAFGDFISKPYPGGGANYETEFYLTINACAGIPRGLYYYDAKEHIISLVSSPNIEMENLLNDAHLATAGQGFPQVLITMANRFNRFNWKYSSMSYAAQLKNIGVIYQTLYLVATSMGIGGCGLGTGNSERFSKITGLNYLEEGSLGEFMIGRPFGN
jgi:oxazoline/thiazoline dehydrogenase